MTVHAQVALGDAHLEEGAASLRWLLLEQLAAGARWIVVDVRGVRRLTPAAAGALLAAHRACRRRGGGVTLLGPTGPSLDLLRRTGLWRVLGLQLDDVVAVETTAAKPGSRPGTSRRTGRVPTMPATRTTSCVSPGWKHAPHADV